MPGSTIHPTTSPGWLPLWELALIVAIIGILFLAQQLPALLHRRQENVSKPARRTWDDFIVWTAEGFGVGRIPVGPGTFGTLLGLLWFALLVRTGSLATFVIGLIAGIAGSIAICSAAERITGRKDPGSVVIDEIVAVPICFVPWLLAEASRSQSFPAPDHFFGPQTWMMSLLIFGLFRVFDIWKPWPIHPSQNLPGGWGVTADDVIAAVFVAVLTWVALI